MLRRKEQPVIDAALAFLRESGLETPLLRYRLVQAWPEVVGAPFSQTSVALEIRDDNLWVSVTTPAQITELQMRRTDLVRRLNERVGAPVIKDIRFVCHPQ